MDGQMHESWSQRFREIDSEQMNNGNTKRIHIIVLYIQSHNNLNIVRSTPYHNFVHLIQPPYILHHPFYS